MTAMARIFGAGWTRKAVGRGAVWLVLLAVALPGYAAVLGVCCQTKAATGSCCAESMKMPAAAGDTMTMSSEFVSLKATASCKLPGAASLPQFLENGERSDEKPLPASGDAISDRIAPTLLNACSSESQALEALHRTSPAPLFDPISVARRI